MQEQEPRTRGLNAIQEARQRRDRGGADSSRYWPWIAGVLAVWGVVYWYVTDTSLDRWRGRLLSEQRAVASEVAPRVDSLRDRVERWTIEASGPWAGDQVSDAAKGSKFRERPGVYLRLHIDDAREVRTIRTAAVESLRDGFTSCFARSDNADPFAGPACTANHDCEAGRHCNQEGRCTAPAQPFNLRTAYRGARVLSDDWAREVATAGDDLSLRVLERDFRSALQDDLPLTVNLVDRAEYFVLVLDEPSSEKLDAPPGKSRSEALQSVAHPARVVVYDLKSNQRLLQVRDAVSADVGVSTTDSEIALAVRRQANNCALALSIGQKLGDQVAAAQ